MKKVPSHKALCRFLCVLLVALSLPVLLGILATQYGHADGGYALQSSRFGFGTTEWWGRDITDYPLSTAQLGAGWYQDFRAYRDKDGNPNIDPPRPNDIAYARVVYIRGNPDWASLETILTTEPGGLWFLGNEPDHPQDASTPVQYATKYHDLYHFIKAYDPTAEVSAGGIVQATPLRMRWMDDMFQAYQDLYGQPIPSDAWHIHEQILREGWNWGCKTPVVRITHWYTPSVGDPFLRTADLPLYCYDPLGNMEYCLYDDYGKVPITQTQVILGEAYTAADNANPDLFKEHIWRFRQWMKANGQQNKPLYINEMGVMMPGDYFPYGDQSIVDFMHEVFHFMLSTTDEDVGLPSDGYRLVQRWAWFTLNSWHDPFNAKDDHFGYNGPLAKWDRDELTIFGHAFKAFTKNAEPKTLVALQDRNSALPGEKHTITAKYTDPDGLSDLDYVSLLVNNRPSERGGGVSLRYDRAANKLYLRNAAGTAWMPANGLTPGADATVSTAYATLHAKDCRVWVDSASNHLIVKWVVSFKDPLLGRSSNVYLKAQDWSGMFDGWNKANELDIGVYFQYAYRLGSGPQSLTLSGGGGYYNYGDWVNVPSAPGSFALGGKTYTFQGWYVDGVYQGSDPLSLPIQASHRAVARYEAAP